MVKKTYDHPQVFLIPTRPPLLFPLLDPTGAVYNPSLAYPYRPAIINSLTAGLLGSLIPLGTILLSQFIIRSLADFWAATLGLLYALATGTCIQAILKKTIGGLRPHFLSVCKPRPMPLGSGVGFNGIMYRVQDVCTGSAKEIEWGIQSFPSGHSEIAFAGFGYLAIYLFTHLHSGDHDWHAGTLGFWRMLLVLMPIVFATYISCTLWLSYHHHATDCLAGAAIGILTALLGFRTAYRSLTDGTMNWKPRVGRRVKRVVDKEREDQATSDHDEIELEQAYGVDGAEEMRDVERASWRRSGWSPPPPSLTLNWRGSDSIQHGEA
jgi:membrane-associated phospholipid phosphatase